MVVHYILRRLYAYFLFIFRILRILWGWLFIIFYGGCMRIFSFSLGFYGFSGDGCSSYSTGVVCVSSLFL
jgi:hypothetical protein